MTTHTTQEDTMSDTTTTTARKTRTITLTGRPPVRIIEADWPVIAHGRYHWYNGQYESQADRTTRAHLRVRQHADGRAIVYGTYDHSTIWQGESDHECRDGQLVPTGGDVVQAIQAVGDMLTERSGDECWRDVIAETVASLPAEDL